MLYKSKFLQIWYDEEHQVLFDKWSSDTKLMTTQNFKEEISTWRDLVIQKSVRYALIDSLEFSFTITPQSQEWVNQYITIPTIEAGLQKMAFVVPQGLFEQVSIEQTMEEFASHNILKVSYFTHQEDAIHWLLS